MTSTHRYKSNAVDMLVLAISPYVPLKVRVTPTVSCANGDRCMRTRRTVVI